MKIRTSEDVRPSKKAKVWYLCTVRNIFARFYATSYIVSVLKETKRCIILFFLTLNVIIFRGLYYDWRRHIIFLFIHRLWRLRLEQSLPRVPVSVPSTTTTSHLFFQIDLTWIIHSYVIISVGNGFVDAPNPQVGSPMKVTTYKDIYIEPFRYRQPD